LKREKMSETDQKKLVELLALKKELMSSMLESLRRAIDLLEGENVDEFNSELERCEDIMRRIDELTEQQAGICVPGAEKPAFIAEAENEIKHIAGQVAEANMECNSVAKEKLKSFGHRLKSIRQKRLGMGGYAHQESAAAFVDMKL